MTKPRTKSSGTTITSLQILTALHEGMKKIRLAIWDRDGVDPKVCRLYAQAVEQWLNAKPQQQLLKEWEDANSKTGKAAGDRLTARV